MLHSLVGFEVTTEGSDNPQKWHTVQCCFQIHGTALRPTAVAVSLNTCKTIEGMSISFPNLSFRKLAFLVDAH